MDGRQNAPGAGTNAGFAASNATNGTQRIQPNVWWTALALPFLLAGLFLGGYLLFADTRRINEAMAHGPIPGELNLELRRNETYTVYVEQPRATNFGADRLQLTLLSVHCQLTSLPYFGVMKVHKPARFTAYTYLNTVGGSLLEFTVPKDATYLFACQDGRGRPGPKLTVAVGSGAPEAIAHTMEKFMVVLGIAVMVALMIFLRVIMLRDRSRKEIRELGLRPV